VWDDTSFILVLAKNKPSDGILPLDLDSQKLGNDASKNTKNWKRKKILFGWTNPTKRKEAHTPGVHPRFFQPLPFNSPLSP